MSEVIGKVKGCRQIDGQIKKYAFNKNSGRIIKPKAARFKNHQLHIFEKKRFIIRLYAFLDKKG